jgi:hypothetical protein
MLATLIFISFRENLQNAGRAQTISNTYDWAKPCRLSVVFRMME